MSKSILIGVAVIIASILSSCNTSELQQENDQVVSQDSIELLKMIEIREQAMINKNLEQAMDQFSENATWINSQGYYFEGKDEIRKFHNMLLRKDNIDYYYEASLPKIRMIDELNALAYYSWKMYWFKKDTPNDTTMKEIGLMSLTAHKYNNEWKWMAVTNQHTPWFYDSIEPVKID